MAPTREKETLCALSQDTSVVICKLDKGNGQVILDKKDYIKNMGTNLKDKAKLQLRKGNANLKNLKTFQEFLGRLKKVFTIKVFTSDQLLLSLQPCMIFQKFTRTIFY